MANTYAFKIKTNGTTIEGIFDCTDIANVGIEFTTQASEILVEQRKKVNRTIDYMIQELKDFPELDEIELAKIVEIV